MSPWGWEDWGVGKGGWDNCLQKDFFFFPFHCVCRGAGVPFLALKLHQRPGVEMVLLCFLRDPDMGKNVPKGVTWMALIVQELVSFTAPDVRKSQVCWLTMSTQHIHRPRYLLQNCLERCSACSAFRLWGTWPLLLAWTCWLACVVCASVAQVSATEVAHSCHVCSKVGPPVLMIFPEARVWAHWSS